jgi:purine-cytosine permease-like protein
MRSKETTDGCGLAVAGILSHVSTMLNDAGDLIIPFTSVMLVDWIYVQKQHTPAEEFFGHPAGLENRFAVSAIDAVAIGLVLVFWGSNFLPSFFYNTLAVVAAIVSAVIYGLAATIWPFQLRCLPPLPPRRGRLRSWCLS